MSRSLKRSFDVSSVREGSQRHVAKTEPVYEDTFPAEYLSHFALQDADLDPDEADRLYEDLISQMEHINIPVVPKQAVNFEFTRKAAFREIPDQVYDRIKNHMCITLCEHGLEDVAVTFPTMEAMVRYMEIEAGVALDQKQEKVEDILDCRFVTRETQKAEANDFHWTGDSDEEGNEEGNDFDVTSLAGKLPESVQSFIDARDDDTLNTVVEDYCIVKVLFSKDPYRIVSWQLVLKDLNF